MVITRPPEIVICLKLPLGSANGAKPKSVFAVFDSHPRPSHPDGAGWFFSKSLDQVAKYLHSLLAVDARLLADTGMQWQAQLLSNFSGHLIVPTRAHDLRPPEEELQQVLWDSSIAILRLQGELEDTKFQNAALTDMNKRYEDEIGELEKKNRELHRRAEIAQRRSAKPSPPAQLSAQSSLATQLSTPSTSRDHRQSVDVKGKRPERSNGRTHSFTAGSSALSPEELQALQLQDAYLEEDRRLRAERETLAKSAVGIFTCSVCMDQHPETDVARIRMCNHALCRECMRGYILTKIRERVFPMRCPICPTEQPTREPGSQFSSVLQDTSLTISQ